MSRRARGLFLLAVLALCACGRLRYQSVADGEGDGGATTRDAAGPADAPGDGATPDGRVLADAGVGSDAATPTRSPFTGCVRPAPGIAALPMAAVDPSPPVTAGEIHFVAAGGDLQAAIDGARPGDVIELEAGATFVGNFVLPPQLEDEWLVIRSSAVDALPSHGERVDPSFLPSMPTLVTPNAEPVITSPPGTHLYRLEGLALRASSDVPLADALLAIGSTDEPVLTSQAHDIVVDRCVILGDPVHGGPTGISFQATRSAIVGSHVADFKSTTLDARAIAISNAPGPLLIANNTLEAAGVNIVFGGPAPGIPGLIPADVEICGNHIAKPLRFMPGHPSFEGTTWRTFELIEIAVGRRVLISGNLMEHAWDGFIADVRPGTWSPGTFSPEVVDVTFANNVIRQVADGFEVTGTGEWTLARVRIVNDLIYDLDNRLVLALDVDGLVVERTTAMPGSHVASAEPPLTGFTWDANVLGPTTWGLHSAGRVEGTDSLEAAAPGAWTFAGNVIVGRPASLYPAGNQFPMTLAEVGFVDPVARDYRLSPGSPYAGTGVDFAVLDAAVLDPY